MTTIRASEISNTFLKHVVGELVTLEDVAHEVKRNYSQNLWWPEDIADIKLRALLAGWTTRVSYSSISSYQNVVERCRAFSFETISKMSDDEVIKLVAGIGLPAARIKYLRSLSAFVDNHASDYLLTEDADVAIDQFANSVEGAGYKVAQCAVLYARGYHCGIIPIDSGLCEMLAPSVYEPYLPYGKGHEVVRKRLEEFCRDCGPYLQMQALHHLNLPYAHVPNPPTWWLHLLLIYYKRLYWNRGKSALFLRDGESLNSELSTTPQANAIRFPYIVLEGVDGSGKTTLARILEAQGYSTHHCRYSEGVSDLYSAYTTILDTLQRPTVFDRFYFSELVYGNFLRGHSRINGAQSKALLELMRERGFVVFILDESEKTLISRRPELNEPRKLVSQYRKLAEYIRDHIPTYILKASSLASQCFPFYFHCE